MKQDHYFFLVHIFQLVEATNQNQDQEIVYVLPNGVSQVIFLIISKYSFTLFISC